MSSNMRSALALVFLVGVVGMAYGNTAYSTEKEYYSTLISLYTAGNTSTSDIIARVNSSIPRTVTVIVTLLALQDVDEVEGTLNLMLSLYLQWNDEVVIASGYNQTSLFSPMTTGVYSLVIPYGKIWTPKILLVNSVDSLDQIGGKDYLPRYDFSTGNVTWIPRVKIRSACTPDVTFYPFDMQTCVFDLVSWGYTESDIVFKPEKNDWDMSFYEENGEWDIIETKTSTYSKYNSSYLRLSITISRKPLFFAFNIIMPILVLVLLNGMVFFLPVESGERVGFSVTCFLSFVVLLNLIMDILPRSSSPMSYLCYYTVSMMIFSGGTTAMVILQMRIFHKPGKDKVPQCVQKFVRVLSCRCRNQIVATETATKNDPEKTTPQGKTKKVLVKPVDEKVTPKEQDEEEITWQDVARFLDMFLFLAFVGGQSMFTLLFVVPVAANA